jgi:phosphotriesterase-related protein
MLRGNVSISRRDLLRLVGSAAGAGVVESWFHTAPAFGQPGAWYAARGPNSVTFLKGSVIRTILKDIPPDQMPNGSVQIHEHVTGVFTRTPPPAQPDMVPGVVAPVNEAEYLALMIEELKMAKADGLGCLVDAAANQRRTHQTVENMRKISSGSNVPIVLGGGYYQDLAIPARYPDDMVELSEDALTDQLVTDAASQRWGSFGEIASSQTMQPEERRLIRAIGRAHVKTKLSIFTHTPHQSCPSCAIEQLDAFESVGVDPRRVCIGHLTAIRPDAEPLAQTAKGLAKRGAFLGFDTVGHSMGRSAIPEAHKVKYVLAVLDAGYEDNLLLSADSTPQPQLKANWGQGYGSVITQFVPKLRYAGVKDAVLHKILVDNPRRLLSFVPPGPS